MGVAIDISIFLGVGVILSKKDVGSNPESLDSGLSFMGLVGSFGEENRYVLTQGFDHVTHVTLLWGHGGFHRHFARKGD